MAGLTIIIIRLSQTLLPTLLISFFYKIMKSIPKLLHLLLHVVCIIILGLPWESPLLIYYPLLLKQTISQRLFTLLASKGAKEEKTELRLLQMHQF
jgi:hypothetical protein